MAQGTLCIKKSTWVFGLYRRATIITVFKMKLFHTDQPTTESGSAATFTKQNITVNSLSSGVVEAVYRSPNKGRVTLNLLNSNDDVLLHVDARFDWYGWMDVLVLNSRTAHGGWQEEVHPKGFPFPCCGYVTTIALRVEIGDVAFFISVNGRELAKYPYRDELCPPVTQMEYIFEDTGASVKARLESLSVNGQDYFVDRSSSFMYSISIYLIVLLALIGYGL